MAEIEFSALGRQCLDRRIADQQTLMTEAIIWQENRNKEAVKVNWSFTTEKARTKLKKGTPKSTQLMTKIKLSEH